MFKHGNVVYTCDCALNNIKLPDYVENDTLHVKDKIYKCNKCKTEVKPKINMKIGEQQTTILCFCVNCLQFVKDDEIFEDYKMKLYRIIKEPLYNQGCIKCFTPLKI